MRALVDLIEEDIKVSKDSAYNGDKEALKRVNSLRLLVVALETRSPIPYEDILNEYKNRIGGADGL